MPNEVMEGAEISSEQERIKNILKRKTWTLESGLPTNTDLLLLDFRKLVYKHIKKAGYMQTYSETIKKLYDARNRLVQLSQQSQNFIESKEFLFTTPLAELRVHPQIQTFITASERVDPPFDEDLKIDSLMTTFPSDLPPLGDLKRDELNPGENVWALNPDCLDAFTQGTIISTVTVKKSTQLFYKVRRNNQPQVLPYAAKHLAYRLSSRTVVPVGTRIVARMLNGGKGKVYPGVVGDCPTSANQYRYLIFLDNCSVQYSEHKDIYVVCAQSGVVADDVCENNRQFVWEYLQFYPEYPMLKLKINQECLTLYNGEWRRTKVVKVDASLVKMLFFGSNRREWIYRGSARLKLLHHEPVPQQRMEQPENVVDSTT